MQYKARHAAAITFTFALIGLPTSAAVAAIPSFTGIGDLPGSTTTSVARGVSGNGLTIVGSGRSASGTDEAIRWDNGVMTPLNALPVGSSATAVSSDGSFIVGNKTAINEAGYWDNGMLVDIGKLPGGCTSKDVTAVSGIGNIIIGESCSSNGHEAYKWQNGVMVGLGDLPGGDFHSVGLGISYDGTYVVGAGHTDQGFQAFRAGNGSMIGLGDLPGGDYGSFGRDVSHNGNAVVGYGKSAASFPLSVEAFRWNNGVMSPLGFLAGFGNRSEANAVSGDGNVVVGFSGRSDLSVQIAFIWTPGTGMRNLKTVLQTDYGLNLAGWTLRQAHDISYDGLTIVGSGINPAGENEGWVVTLPEPSSLSLFFIGAAALVARRAGRDQACTRISTGIKSIMS